MIGYVQSVIAAKAPAATQRKPTDEDWNSLRSKVETLFRTLNISYQVCRTAKAQLEDKNFDQNFEEFQFKAQMYWCNVRGQRYQIHEPVALSEMFSPHSDVLSELFDISSEQFVEEMKKIWHALSFGIGDAFQELDAFRNDTLRLAEEKIEAGAISAEAQLSEQIDQIVKEQGWEKRRDDVAGKFLGLDLFNVQKVTNLPEKLLNELSWSPGSEKDFFAPGDFSGWPLRIWPTFKRPFIYLSRNFYCFDLYGLFDNLYRVMQRIILRLKPGYAERWKLSQQALSEGIPLKYFEQLLPGAKLLKSVFYRGRTDSGALEWCETDGLVIYDDHLFVIEARGGAFTYTPPATDFPAYLVSIKNLILKPATQGSRFIEYLSSADSVTLFDKDHNEIDALKRGDFRQVTICPITIDPFTELASQVQHLKKVGVDVGSLPVWAISVDDLRVYADIFDSPLRFLHYVEHRMKAFETTDIQSEDELDHLGLYLKHNNYSQYAGELRANLDRLSFHGYRSEIDKFFKARMLDGNAPCPLKQETPKRIQEIVDFLSKCNKPGRTEISSFLLDFGETWRTRIANAIDEELERQPDTKRAKPFSTVGSVPMTIFCWCPPWATRDARIAEEHTTKAAILGDDKRRLLLELELSEVGELKDINWKWISIVQIPATSLPNCAPMQNTCGRKELLMRRKNWGRSQGTSLAHAAAGESLKNAA